MDPAYAAETKLFDGMAVTRRGRGREYAGQLPRRPQHAG
jgi:hypothetical protein